MMGSALSYPASDNGHEVRVVGTCLDDDIITGLKANGYHKNTKRYLPKKNGYYYFPEAEKAVRGADLIISGVSSYGVEWFAENALPLIPDGVPVLSVTKGLIAGDDGSLTTVPDLLKKRFEEIRPGEKLSISAVGGPCTSYELCDRNQTYVAFCGEDEKTLGFIRDLMKTDYYHVDVSTDVKGIECAVAMKNAYALAVSLAIGMGISRDGEDAPEHYNSQAALFAQSVREMKRLIKYMGGKEDSLVFGAGDLYVTIFGGRTRRIGTLLGEGVGFDAAMETLRGVTLESVSITRSCTAALLKAAEKKKIDLSDFPLLMHIRRIIEEGASPEIPWDDFH